MKMKLLILQAAVLLALSLCFCGTADTLASGACGDAITWELDDSGTLTLTGTGRMWDYRNDDGGFDYHACPWSEVRTHVRRVVIPDGITYIGADAFRDMVNLSEVTLPDTLDQLAPFCFMDCSNLTAVELPEGLRAIGQNAFQGTALRSVVIPGSVTFVDACIFENCRYLTNALFRSPTSAIGTYIMANNQFPCCPALESIDVEEGHPALTGIDGILFNGGQLMCYPQGRKAARYELPAECSSIFPGAFRFAWDEGNLREVVIPEGFALIGDNSFDHCFSLERVTIPDSVTSIGKHAFRLCRNLEEIVIPDSVTSLGFGAFDNSGLKRITISANVTALPDELLEGCVSLTDVVFGGNVNSIGNHCFAGARSLTSFTIPDGVTSIGEYAFQNAKGLVSVTIPDSVVQIGEGAFSQCDNLSEVHCSAGSHAADWAVANGLGSLLVIEGTVPEGVWTAVPSGTGCAIIAYTGTAADLVIPDMIGDRPVTSIGAGVFREHLELASVSIPAAVASVGDYAFMGCENLETAFLPPSPTIVQKGVFQNCFRLRNTVIPEGVTAVGDHAFDACLALSSVVIPEGVSSIGSNAFYNCESLTNLCLPDSLVSLGFSAFDQCTGLETVHIGSGTVTIDMFAFRGCRNLSEITVSPDNTAFTSLDGILYSKDLSVLYLCPMSKASVSIPDGVTRIEGYAFGENRFLTSLIIPEGVTSIGERAFQACAALSSISLPESLTCFENYVFESCPALTEIFIPRNVSEIGEGVFTNCTVMQSIQVAADNLYFRSEDGLLYDRSGFTLIACPAGRTEVSVAQGVRVIGIIAFYGCSGLREVSLPDTVTSIGYQSFAFCSNLTEMVFPDSLTHIEMQAFLQCPNLRRLVIPASGITIVDPIFDCCSPIIFGVSGSAAQDFAESRGLRFYPIIEMATPDFTLPDGLTGIEDEAFSGCVMTVVFIPDSVSSIGNKAFARCTFLEQIRIPPAINMIPSDVFDGIDISQLTIFGAPDSEAEAFAAEKGIRFVAQ